MIWDGVYETFAEIPHERGSEHAPDEWIERSISRKLALEGDGRLEPLPLFSASPFALFLPLIRVLGAKSSAVVTEVGGNLGQLALFTTGWVEKTQVYWQVIERSEFLCNPKVQAHLNSEISWTSSLEGLTRPTDILYFGSSLQYIENLSDEILPFLKNDKPEWVVISDGMIGEKIPTFCTWQHYYLHGFPAKFRNFDDLLDEFASVGYKLSMRAAGLTAHNRHYYPSNGLPTEYQIDHPMDLIFRLK